jgi:hypothetical protein
MRSFGFGECLSTTPNWTLKEKRSYPLAIRGNTTEFSSDFDSWMVKDTRFYSSMPKPNFGDSLMVNNGLFLFLHMY